MITTIKLNYYKAMGMQELLYKSRPV